MTLPNIIAHADWGTSPDKRWVVKATLADGVYQIGGIDPVADLQEFVAWVCRECADNKQIMLGFDVPIGRSPHRSNILKHCCPIISRIAATG